MDNSGLIICSTNGKKSWQQIKSTVTDFRRRMSNLSSIYPMNVSFRTLSDGRIRMYFLSPPPNNGWETVLFFVDIPANENDDKTPMK